MTKYWVKTDATPPITGPLTPEDISYRFKEGTFGVEAMILEFASQPYDALNESESWLPLTTILDSEGKPLVPRIKVEETKPKGRYYQIRDAADFFWWGTLFLTACFLVFSFSAAKEIGAGGSLSLLGTTFFMVFGAFFAKCVLILLADISESLSKEGNEIEGR